MTTCSTYTTKQYLNIEDTTKHIVIDSLSNMSDYKDKQKNVTVVKEPKALETSLIMTPPIGRSKKQHDLIIGFNKQHRRY